MTTLFIITFLFVYVAIRFVRFLVHHDRGPQEPRGALWVAFCYGLLGAVIALILELLLIPGKYLADTTHLPLHTIAAVALAIGLIEEASKFLLLARHIYRKAYFNEHSDGVIYFALAGLGFGLPENILYTVSFGASAGLLRLILTPFFHSALTALVGYQLARVKFDHKSKGRVMVALLVAAGLHAVYDFGAFSGRVSFALVSFGITIGMTIYLLYLLHRANVADAQDGLDRLPKS
jgi:RsiW-degrading membrane proteinase PrsW (M82 family)